MFDIQIQQQRVLNNRNSEDRTISEAIATIYSSYENELKIVWNDLIFVLDFNSDLSIIFNDILNLINDIDSMQEKFNVSFLSSTFTAKWEFDRESDIIIVSPSIYQGYVLRNGEFIDQDNLDSIHSELRIQESDFKAPWIELLNVIKSDLVRAEYNDTLEDIDSINRILN